MTPRVKHLSVEANGITFHVAVAGRQDAPPVLCLHGFPEGWMSWRPVMRGLEGLRVIAPDLRGYGDTDNPRGGYDVFTLTDDVRALIEALGLERPVLVGHDWGGAIAWIFAHRHSDLISRLMVVNCTHPRTLVRAVLRAEDMQTFRIPWVPFFELPWLPELLIATPLGRRLLKLSFTLREAEPGAMDRALVDELVARFRTPGDARPRSTTTARWSSACCCQAAGGGWRPSTTTRLPCPRRSCGASATARCRPRSRARATATPAVRWSGGRCRRWATS
jgi:pimeloyl-ACP methyl ester carboxylesterase